MDKKIGIIGAMELEVADLKESMDFDKVTKRAGRDFFEGTLEGISVVVVQCGIGKVNAGICVQVLADMFGVTHVVNTGVAGALNPELNIGDILVSKKALQHDMDVSPLGYKPGQVPGLEVLEFEADKDMADCIYSVCMEVNPDIKVKKGVVVSGDQFISSAEIKERLVNDFHGDCAEMEGAAIAQAAYLNGLPFVVVRALSDKADGAATVDYPTFEKEAAGHCARLVKEFVKNF